MWGFGETFAGTLELLGEEEGLSRALRHAHFHHPVQPLPWRTEQIPPIDGTVHDTKTYAQACHESPPVEAERIQRKFVPETELIHCYLLVLTQLHNQRQEDDVPESLRDQTIRLYQRLYPGASVPEERGEAEEVRLGNSEDSVTYSSPRMLAACKQLCALDPSELEPLDTDLFVPCNRDGFELGRSFFGGCVNLALWTEQKKLMAVREVACSETADFCIRRLEDFTKFLTNHSHLLPYTKILLRERTWYLARDVCDWNLDQYLEQMRRSNHPDPTTPLLYHMIKGLAFLHSKIPTLFHGNLKPSNIMVSDGVLRLADWGFGRLCTLRHQFHGHPLVTPQGLLHPVCWKPPEFYCVSKTYSGLSDVFSAAMLGYYLLTLGTLHPFLGSVEQAEDFSGKQLQTMVCKGRLALDGISEEAVHLLKPMLEVEIDRRPFAEEVLIHPLFWEESRRLAFLRALASEKDVKAEGIPLVLDPDFATGDLLQSGDWSLSGVLALLLSAPPSTADLLPLAFPRLLVTAYQLVLDNPQLREAKSLRDFFLPHPY